MLFRGVDLLDLYRGTLSLRRLKLLIEQTPLEDQMWRMIQADEGQVAAKSRRDLIAERTAHYARRSRS